MCGTLNKQSIKLKGNEGGDDLVNMVISGFSSGIKLGLKIFADTIQIKAQRRKYFAIKNGILYCYKRERAREAAKEIIIKDTKAIEINDKNPKEFYVIYQNKCYKLEASR